MKALLSQWLEPGWLRVRGVREVFTQYQPLCSFCVLTPRNALPFSNTTNYLDLKDSNRFFLKKRKRKQVVFDSGVVAMKQENTVKQNSEAIFQTKLVEKETADLDTNG